MVLTTKAQSVNRVERMIKSLKNPDGKAMVSAHRGDWRNAPENSLQGITNCINMGIDIIEVDVRKTKDGHFILMHDKTLDRTTSGKGKVSSWTLDSLKTLFLRDGISTITEHKIPTLLEALELSQNRVLLYLDKTLYEMPQTLAFLDSLDLLSQVIFMHPVNCEEAIKVFGDYLDRVNFIARLENDVKNPKLFIDEYLDKGIRPLAFQLRLTHETEGQVNVIQYLKENNFRICVSTIWPRVSANHNDDKAIKDPDAHWGWHLQKGVSIFNTDRPARLLEYLRSKGLHD